VAAEDNLGAGRTVIADSVNPIQLTRDPWITVAKGAEVMAVEIKITYSDIDEHRRRVETRVTDIRGSKLPTWQEVVLRDYSPWRRDRILIDTAHMSVEQSVKMIRDVLANASHA
jgi:predicted kinase